MDNKKIIISVVIGFAVLAIGSYSIGANVGTNNSSGAVKGTTTVNTQPGLKEFNIIMQGSTYYPSRITVNENDRIVLNITNRDRIAHAVGIPHFNATVPGGHVAAGQTVTMTFVANRKGSSDAALCGGPKPEDKTDAHGEELIVQVI